MKLLFLISILSVLALIIVPLAAYLRVRRHMRSSDRRLKLMLEEIEREHRATHSTSNR